MKVTTYANEVYSKTEVQINYENKTDSPIELIIEIPLKQEIVFNYFIAKIKDKIIKSKIIETSKAEEKYSDAISKGDTGISSTYNLEEKLYSVKIGNIPQKETLELKCYFIQLISIKNGFYCLNLMKDFPKIKNFNSEKFEGKIIIETFSQITDIKTDINGAYSNDNKKYIIEYNKNTINRILFKTKDIEKPFLISQYNKRLDETNYILKYYCNNENNENVKNKYPCLFIILIDQSYSMSDCFKSVSKSLSNLIQSFPENCYYQLIGFGSDYEKYNQIPELNTKSNIEKSLKIIEALESNQYSTHLSYPLKDIFKKYYNDYKDINLSKQIIVLTDGDINIGDDIIELINLHNNEFKIHLIGIGDDVNKQLIIDTSNAGNGSYNFIDDTSNLQNKINEIINNCTKEYINNYKFILNDTIYELQPINKTAYINESMHYCYILKGNEKKNFNIKFNYENLNQKFMKDMLFKSGEIFSLSEGEELSKLIIGSALKYDLGDEINLSKKYQVLSKSTSLYAEIEGDKSLENQMNTFVQKYSIHKINESKISSSSNSNYSRKNYIYEYCGGGCGGLSHGAFCRRRIIIDEPTHQKSYFYEEGKLTPEQFVEAGDFLISKCPIWKWCEAKDHYYNKALPKDKQYLKITVPSFKRAIDYLKDNSTIEKVLDGGWVDVDLENIVNKDIMQRATIDLNIDNDMDKNKDKNIFEGEDDDDDFIIEGENNSDFEIFDEGEKKDQSQNLKRIYDVSVTYDFYYCVPRMWLMGYNEQGSPLSNDEMKEDILPEYSVKTCTIEPQACTGIRSISIHPCRHSLLLKKMIQDFQNSGKKLEAYMSIFVLLKFLQTIVPTVQYDFTVDISF